MSNKYTSIPFLILVILTGIDLIVAIWLVLFVAPVEEVMGVVQKIFYFHVPSAMAMYAGVGMMSVSSLIYLITSKPKWDRAGRVGSELATLFCIIVLVTGPIWASEAWGQPWVWDPRLTGVAVLGLILGSYHLIRSVGEGSLAAKKLASALGVFAAPIGYLIHAAVRLWGGLHPTVIYERGGMDPLMRDIFLYCIGTALMVFTVLAWLRLKILSHLDKIEDLQRRAQILETDRYYKTAHSNQEGK